MLQDEYEEDSFVNDDIEYESSTADELDFVQEHKDMVKEKSNQKKPCQKTTLKKRKRIIISSSEDDEEIPSKLVETPPKHDEEIPSKVFETPPKPHPVAANSLLESPVTQNINGVPILVNASEVHKSQEIISLLKHTHNLNVHVQSKFEGAGFLLSSRYSIDSILISSLHPLTDL